MKLNWTSRPFPSLSGQEVHDMLRLRVDVFVVEQQCAYAEVDGRDAEAIHVMGRSPDGTLVAYARVLPSVGDSPVRIGRVVVRSDQRGRGIADLLMRHALQAVRAVHGNCRVVLAAQAQLERFYAGFGFVRTGPVYDWDGIPHVDMERPPDLPADQAVSGSA